MADKPCEYCGSVFRPRPQTPGQLYCGDAACQRVPAAVAAGAEERRRGLPGQSTPGAAGIGGRTRQVLAEVARAAPGLLRAQPGFDVVLVIGRLATGGAELVLDVFPKRRYGGAMTDAPDLRPATPDELAETLAFALRYDGRKRVHHADSMMARVAADRLVRHLERSGFVVMKREPRPDHSASSHPHPHRG